MTDRHDTVFSDVDSSGIAPELIAYLEAVGARPEMQTLDAASYDMLDIGPGQRLLDVGCGLGDDAREMARRVAPGGGVTAVDRSQTMVAEARRRHHGEPVDYEVGDITKLGYPDGSFDGARAERVIQHVHEAQAAVGEMARVVRPGGRVALVDVDWQTFLVDVPQELARRMAAHVFDSFARPTAGRGLRGLLVEAGLKDVDVRAFPMVFTSLADARVLLPQLNPGIPATEKLLPAEMRDEWFAAVDEAEAAGRFFASITGFVAAGQKPVG